MIRICKHAVALLLAVLGVQSVASADVIGVRSLPTRAFATASQDFSVALNWSIKLDASGRGGVRSPGGTFVDALSGAPLGLAVSTTLDSGPGAAGNTLLLSELLSVDSATLATWYRQGIRRVGYRRPFISAATGRALTAQLIIDLSRSTLDAARDGGPGELRVLRMEIAFASGKRIELAPRSSRLSARLTVSYAGSGVLRGRWQLAEPGSGATALFRTLGFVRKNLAATQRATLVSPKLPTDLSGHYALRFCLETAGESLSDECGDSSSGVIILYDVAPDEAAATIGGLTPNGGGTEPASRFRWREVDGTVIYQVQIARPVADHTEFVTGVLVPGTSPSVTLSPLTLSKLSDGQRYRWRVTAHDEQGHLLAISDSAEFVYRP